MKEYYIKYNGYYIQETEQGYFSVLDLAQATPFPSTSNALAFVNDDMCLNGCSVELVAREVITHDTELVLVDGEWLDKSLCGQCEECNTWHKLMDMDMYSADRDTTTAELLCADCIEKLEDKGFYNVYPEHLKGAML